jgi:hypothetical protein
MKFGLGMGETATKQVNRHRSDLSSQLCLVREREDEVGGEGTELAQNGPVMGRAEENTAGKGSMQGPRAHELICYKDCTPAVVGPATSGEEHTEGVEG